MIENIENDDSNIFFSSEELPNYISIYRVDAQGRF